MLPSNRPAHDPGTPAGLNVLYRQVTIVPAPPGNGSRNETFLVDVCCDALLLRMRAVDAGTAGDSEFR